MIAVRKNMEGTVKKEMLRCIYVPQARIARLDKVTIKEGVIGLYTEGFTTCIIVVMISADKSRVSLIHADIETERSHVDTELDWVGKDCKVHLVIKKRNVPSQYTSLVISKLFGGRDTGWYQHDVEQNLQAVILNIGMEQPKTLDAKFDSARLEYHPNQQLLDTISRLNLFLSAGKHKIATFLIYDGVWLTPPKEQMTLCAEAQMRIKEMGINNKSEITQIKTALSHMIEHSDLKYYVDLRNNRSMYIASLDFFASYIIKYLEITQATRSDKIANTDVQASHFEKLNLS